MRLLVCLIFFTVLSPVFAAENTIKWVDWSPNLFEKAKRENKLVILDLEAVWCHWCHVMEKQTYSDPKVIELIRSRFIAVRVDQDARPDISRRYEDYGWPATIFFDSSGRELAKRSGFFAPDEMVPLLEKLIKKPSPEEKNEKKADKIPESPFLSKQLRAALLKEHKGQYDKKQGGWGSVHKFLFGDTEEFTLRNAWRGSEEDKKRAKQTLTAALELIDPVWGGAYQYSVDTWKEPHFEKIVEAQMKNLVLYSEGYALFQDPAYLKAAQDVRRYLATFLKSPEGVFYTSQDADLERGVHSDGYFKLGDKERRAKGIPIIDKHIYARENGWLISGLASLYAVTLDKTILDDAITATKWIEKNRSLSGGGFSHDKSDVAGPFLGDTLEMGYAYVQLYQVTGDRDWLKRAKTAAGFIQENFFKDGAYVTSSTGIAKGIAALPIRDENIRLVRFTNQLFHYTGDEKFKKMSIEGMRYLATPSVAEEIPTGGILLAEQELSERPVHLTVVGGKKDSEARALFEAALKYPVGYKRVDWWDKEEGNLPNPDVQYPQLKVAAAFACKEGRCSLPIIKSQELQARVDQLYK